MKKSGENCRFCHVFHGAFIVFSLQFGGGYPRKIAGNHKSVCFFSLLFSAKPCFFFHKVFVAHTLAKQWKNQKKTVHLFFPLQFGRG